VSVGSAGRHERVLDPVERLSEVLFGLIMVLSFTRSIDIASAGREDVREVLIGAIGCNLAWGIVDAVMYLRTILVERGRGLRIARAVRASTEPSQGRTLIAEALPEPLDEIFGTAALESARTKIVELANLEQRPRLTGRDWRGAFGVFLLVFLSTFPVVVPFLFVKPLQQHYSLAGAEALELTMHLSSGVAIAMLYLSGHLLGRHAGFRPVRTGLVMAAIGLVLVGITIALGG
jgi:hypothetical protein